MSKVIMHKINILLRTIRNVIMSDILVLRESFKVDNFFHFLERHFQSTSKETMHRFS